MGRCSPFGTGFRAVRLHGCSFTVVVTGREESSQVSCFSDVFSGGLRGSGLRCGLGGPFMGSGLMKGFIFGFMFGPDLFISLP